MYLREIVYEAVLAQVTTHDWRKHLETAGKNKSYKDRIHEMFQPLREQVLDAPDWSAIVRNILGTLGQKDQDQTGDPSADE
jgi:hypothetical protein